MDKYQEATDYFYKQMELGKIQNDEQQDMYEIAIDAIGKAKLYDKKETAKEVLHNLNWDNCGNCNMPLVNYEVNDISGTYCKYCGHKIKNLRRHGDK